MANNTITQTRNRLDSETAREILSLKSWIENKLGINMNNEELSININNSNSNYHDSGDSDSDYHDSSDSNSSSYYSDNSES